jgi:hypothetical protein
MNSRNSRATTNAVINAPRKMAQIRRGTPDRLRESEVNGVPDKLDLIFIDRVLEEPELPTRKIVYPSGPRKNRLLGAISKHRPPFRISWRTTSHSWNAIGNLLPK